MNWTLIIFAAILGAVFFGGLAIMAAVGSSRVSRLEEGRHYLTPTEVAPMTPRQREQLLAKLSDGLIDDYTVWTDDMGEEHLIPKASPRHAAEDRPPPAA